MAKHDAKGRSKTGGKHVRLYEWEMKCPAYRSLATNARCLLAELKRRFNGDNNGHISMSLREAETLINCSRRPVMRAFKELTETGFIKPRQKGSFNWKTKHATTWILTEYPFNGSLPTKEFMSWKKGATVSPRDTEKLKEAARERKNTGVKTSPDRCQNVTREAFTGVKTSPDRCQNVTREAQIHASDGCQNVTTINIPYTHAGRAASSKLSLAGVNNQSKQSNNSAHSILAERLGEGETGWLLLMSLESSTIDSLLAKSESGTLKDSDVAAAQLEAGKNEREASHG